MNSLIEIFSHLREHSAEGQAVRTQLENWVKKLLCKNCQIYF